MGDPNNELGPASPDDTVVIEPGELNRPAPLMAVGRFQIVRIIAQGANCTIYEVTGPNSSGKRLALKRLNSTNASLCRWFERSAHISATLNHPHILPCLEYGRHAEVPYRIMPLIDGETMRERFHAPILPQPREVVRIAHAVASALDDAHDHSVVHGCVHPKHILMDHADHVWLTGFGEMDCGCKDDFMVWGNLHLLAPEQFASFDNTVPQTDVYALAEVAFWLLTGMYPFRDIAGQKLHEQKRAGRAPGLRTLRPELHPSVDRVLQRAMAMRPQDRFRSAGQFVDELESALRVRGPRC